MVTLALDPPSPINNDPQATIDFIFTLDEEPLEDPNVFYQINDGDLIPITDLITDGEEPGKKIKNLGKTR